MPLLVLQRLQVEPLLAPPKEYDPITGMGTKQHKARRRTAIRRVRRVRRKDSSTPKRKSGGSDEEQECQLLLKMNIASVKPGTRQRADFESQLVEDLVMCLKCSEEQLELLSVQERGSRLLVRFLISSGSGKQGRSAKLAGDLIQMAQDQGSELYAGEVTWRHDRSFDEIIPVDESAESKETGYESYYEDEEYFLDEAPAKVSQHEDEYDDSEPIEQTLRRLIAAIKRYHEEAEGSRGSAGVMKEKAAEGFAQKTLRWMVRGSQMDAFNTWKAVVFDETLGKLGTENADLQRSLWMLQVKAADTFARKVFQGWAVGAIADAFAGWKELGESMRWERGESERGRLNEELYAMKQNAAAMNAKKVITNWRNRSLYETFQTWANLTRAKRAGSIQEQLNAALQNENDLRDKVAKLQKKLEKATYEKKALLDEVNRHVGLLL